MNNHCTITVKGTDETFEGKLDNLSANGFAFLSKTDFSLITKAKSLLFQLIILICCTFCIRGSDYKMF